MFDWFTRILFDRAGAAVPFRWFQTKADYWKHYNAIARSGLFDRKYYLSNCPDISPHRDPLRHYIKVGWKQRLDPSPRFSTSFYLLKHADVEKAGVEPLLHYIDHGSREGRVGIPEEDKDYRLLKGRPDLFDVDFYLHQYSDVARAQVDPITHFLCYGKAELRRPSATFDIEYYIANNPDCARTGLNPLVHYILYGEKEDRAPNSGRCRYSRFIKPDLIGEDWISSIQPPQRSSDSYILDVIIPVYGQTNTTLNCIFSVLSARQNTNFELVVIDDASPEQDLRDALQKLSARGIVTLITNAVNQGFPETVNIGMSVHPDRDVILLNSDTLVYGNWIDRIMSLAHRGEKIATITPLSNNATICSYPRWDSDNNFRFEVADAEIDALAAQVNEGQTVEIPTGVGSCMYVSRSSLYDVGLFNSRTFGAGYGEEVDFCLRARNRGWKNLLAGNVFVRHFGSMSFTHRTNERKMTSAVLLREMHPHYESDLERHAKENPAKSLRAQMDLARVKRAMGQDGSVVLISELARLKRPAGAGSVVLISHDIGGGTERHVQDLRAALSVAGVACYIFRFDRGNKRVLRLDSTGVVDAVNLPEVDLSTDVDIFVNLLGQLDARHIHVHHLLGAPAGALGAIARTASALSIRYDVTLHDFFTICPRVTLVTGDGRYCGQRQAADCDLCVASSGSAVGVVSVGRWRNENLDFLERARSVFVPSADVERRMSVYGRELPIVLRPHWFAQQPPRAATQTGPVRRILLIGAVNHDKGSLVLKSTAKTAMEAGVPIEFVVVGHTDIDSELEPLPNVAMTGRYRENELSELVVKAKGDAFWLPSIWPETFSYTFHFATMAGLYPVAFDIGAPAQVIRDSGWGTLLPLSAADDPMKILNCLTGLKIPTEASPLAATRQASYSSILRDYYGFDSNSLPAAVARHFPSKPM